MTKSRARRTIFLSHADADADAANRVAEALARTGLRVRRLGNETPAGRRPTDVLDSILAASDVVVMLISPAYLSSRWASEEMTRTLDASLSNRAISVVPALIAPSDLPEPLRRLPAVDLRNPDALRTLATRLHTVDVVDFDLLESEEFERLVAALLRRLGFELVSSVRSERREWDFVGTYRVQGPFGSRAETWGVEIKRYGKERRLGLALVSELHAAVVNSRMDKVLIVTSGQVTSVVRSYVADVNEQGGQLIEVLEGNELTVRLLEYPDLVAAFFGTAA